MFQLRPTLLAESGLCRTIHALADQTHAETGARVHVRCTHDRYPAPVETVVYRTVREALCNVRRHAPPPCATRSGPAGRTWPAGYRRAGRNGANPGLTPG
jgi:signal transduction histidine kinase